jgi:hypothetical protein
MIYACYVCMGGLVTDVSAIHDVLSRVTITPDGVRLMAYLGHFPEVSDKSIQDKSKADYLAKSLVCIQVLWTVAQIIDRKITGYPITILEVHTLVNVFCALVLYGLWFQNQKTLWTPHSWTLLISRSYLLLCSSTMPGMTSQLQRKTRQENSVGMEV